MTLKAGEVVVATALCRREQPWIAASAFYADPPSHSYGAASRAASLQQRLERTST